MLDNVAIEVDEDVTVEVANIGLGCYPCDWHNAQIIGHRLGLDVQRDHGAGSTVLRWALGIAAAYVRGTLPK